MQINARTVIAACVPALVLISCARQAPPVSSPAPSRQQVQRRATPRPASASAYVATAAAIDLYEIRSSELALQRSSSSRLRDFASMMIQAHKGTSAQLSLAGRRLNLLPSAALDAKRQALIDRLQAAPNFDALYKQQQLAVHQDALALHRNYAARGTSPTLRPVAAAIVPVIERHLRLLRYL